MFIMIKAIFYMDSDSNYIGFCVSGHAGYARKGRDIVCSAVSVLTINTVNAVGKLTENEFKLENEKSGSIKFKFLSKPDEKGQLLLSTLSMGLTELYGEYGDEYLRVYFKEV